VRAQSSSSLPISSFSVGDSRTFNRTRASYMASQASTPSSFWLSSSAVALRARLGLWAGWGARIPKVEAMSSVRGNQRLAGFRPPRRGEMDWRETARCTVVTPSTRWLVCARTPSIRRRARPCADTTSTPHASKFDVDLAAARKGGWSPAAKAFIRMLPAFPRWKDMILRQENSHDRSTIGTTMPALHAGVTCRRGQLHQIERPSHHLL
jgi:hypothetical protein